MIESPDLTALLHQTTRGSADAAERLAAIVYDELRGMARRFLVRERRDHTLQATELAHEAYLRLVDQTRCQWQDRAHFLAVASLAMRRILVDHARRRNSAKRGGGRQINLDDATDPPAPEPESMVLDLDMALARLAGDHPEIARLVELRVFGGLTHAECAAVLGVSARTASRHWEFGQAWLYRELKGGAA